MKCRLLSMTVWLSALCMGFTACGDKEKTEDNNLAQAIAGTYGGNLSVGGAAGNSAQIVIARVGDRQVTLKMNETVLGLPVNIECSTEVVYTGNLYRISGNTTFNMGTEAAPVVVPVVVDGTIDGGGKASIHINVEVPAIGSVAVTFEGQKQ
ncbi:MAG: calycin-like domain-containing protein [Tannerella sp.]|nr:calycin-like domain-containing protein [Tannerella sp.]